MATIQDIADAVGISKAAVSRILNHKGSFSEETIVKVMAEARRLNYSTPGMYQPQEEIKLKIISAIFPSSSNSYFGVLASLMEQEAYKYGYSFMLSSSMFNKQKIQDMLDNLKTNLVNGVILGTYADQDFLSGAAELPIVTVGYQLSDRIPAVMSDNYSAGILAGRHLYTKGCRKILYLSRNLFGLQKDQRYLGLRSVAEKNGLQVWPYYLSADDMAADNLIGVITSMLLKHPDAEGIFAETQHLSMTCLKVLLDLGYEIPGAIKLIGYGNPYVHSYSNPELTIIRENTREIAKKAVETLVDIIEEKSVDEKRKLIRVPVSLELHQST